ncbi:MAG: tetratricopeptide repeat protein [Planctomycetes bacterium]|nr:tetratricopeptide repeat protein [Planctomycetota bacterium]
MHRATLLKLSATCVFFLLSGILGADEIILENASHRGVVTIDDCKSVEIRSAEGSGTLTFEQDKVKQVIYQQTPPAFTSAQSAARLGNYEGAADGYEEALNQRHNPLLTQYILYGMGDAYARIGDVDRALEIFGRLLKEHPRTKFLYNTIDTSIHLKIQKQDWDGAKDLLPPLKEVDPDNAAYLSAFIQENQGKFNDAIRSYSRVAAATDGVNDAIYSQAKSGELRCAFKLDKFNDVRTVANDILSRGEGTPAETLASVYYYLGQIEMKQGRTDIDKLTKALDSFVRVFVLYDRPSTRAIAAEACYHAGELCEHISTKDQPQLKKEGKRIFAYCASKYTGTSWAERALAKSK